MFWRDCVFLVVGYLNSPALPAHFWTLFERQLARGTGTAFETTPFGKRTAHDVFLPQDTRLPPFLADYHAHVIMLLYFTEGYRHRNNIVSRTFQFPSVWEALQRDGYVKLPRDNEHVCLSRFSEQLVALVVRQKPTYPELLFDLYRNVSITTPHTVQSRFAQTIDI